MTHQLDPVTHWIADDSKRFELTLTDSDGDAVQPQGTDEINWRLQNTLEETATDAVIDESSSDVTVSIEDASAGRVDVFVAQDNDVNPGEYWMRIEHDPAGDTKQSWRGRVRIGE